MVLRTSVLIPSYHRPSRLTKCLLSLAEQTRAPDEVIVVWQADDAGTRDAAEAVSDRLPGLRVLHSPEAGIVVAENRALLASEGEVILLIDDDAVAPPDWIAKHLAHYADPTVGAVGGPARNFRPDGTLGPDHAAEPIGRLTRLGRVVGNMYDHPQGWSARPPREVDHLVGYNLSLRRAAIDRFESGLKAYWQGFELDACLQVKAGGYRVLFDFGNVVQHFPSNTVYGEGRSGDLERKIYHGAFNRALVLSKHSPLHLRPPRLLFMLLVGTTNTPGLLGSLVALRRYGHPLREATILVNSLRSHLSGWRAGARTRR